MPTPLEGIRVLDWTQWQMGPWAAAMLAELGAEVIHIENPVTGDHGRGLGQAGLSDLPQGKTAYFEINNRGKKSIALDLVKEEGKEVIYRLVRNSDVFLNNFRQGVPERLKLDYETLCKYNPKLIYAAASGYGPKGPDSQEPAFDVVGLARSGIMTMIGGPDDPPLNITLGIADQMGAIMTAYGIMTAIVARERFGIGQKVDASHLGSMMALQGLGIGMQLYYRPDSPKYFKPDRKAARNPLWNQYQCKGGEWIMLGMLQPDRQWGLICKGLGMEYLENDPKFDNADSRRENSRELIAIMDDIFKKKSVHEWMRTFKETGDIICTPVQSIADLENDPQVLANDYIIDQNHEVIGPVKVLGMPIQLSKTPGFVKCEAPEFGQHTEEVLKEVGGYTWEEISELKEKEVII